MNKLKVFSILILISAGLVFADDPGTITLKTTSGDLQGTEQDGIISFKGIRYAQPPIGERRWQPPLSFASNDTADATKLGPSCIQQFAYASANETRQLLNNPPPPEDEDCLYLNVWAPSLSDSGTESSPEKKPVVVWIYGGGLTFGTASLALYDGKSLVESQDIVFVSFNYRTNVFGFPAAPELPVAGNNLGLMDQDLALDWVQRNIEKFGGDPEKVTIMGQSAGGLSIATALTRYAGNNTAKPPFQAAIMFSANIGVGLLSATPEPFNNFSTTVGCTQEPGDERLACLKNVSADVISGYLNGPEAKLFSSVTTDNVTVFGDPIKRIGANQSARVPLMLGNTKDEGLLFQFESGAKTLGDILQSLFGEAAPDEELVRGAYPGLNDTQMIPVIASDLIYQCPANLWANATVASGMTDVYRYIYGPKSNFIPGFEGTPHAAELPILFGYLNQSTAKPEELELSRTFQTVIGNFIKNPTGSDESLPAPGWAKYGEDGNLAKLAFEGNVEMENIAQMVKSSDVDGPCKLWNEILLAMSL
ncbi:hypothetical protein PQX77_021096 [Marasmius sp. AFHP31]|nr:hypothetical protein PQX77_021096 [Marasmius sp. AFHP31]